MTDNNIQGRDLSTLSFEQVLADVVRSLDERAITGAEAKIAPKSMARLFRRGGELMDPEIQLSAR